MPIRVPIPAGLQIPLIALCALGLVGCRNNPNGSQATFPWGGNSAAGVAQAAPGDPNGWNPPASPYAATSADPQLADVLQRHNEQVRITAEQRQALAQLTEQHRLQSQQLDQFTSQRRLEELQKLQQQADIVRQQQQELAGMAELRRRALEMDANNRDLLAQLAQAQQQNRLYEDQTRLLKQQLSDTSSQLATTLRSQAQASQQLQTVQSESAQRIQQARLEAQQRMQELEATMARRGGATIRANSSVRQKLALITINGIQVRQDGDVIRIELPSDQIFVPGTAQLNPQASEIVDRVANAVRQNYSRQIIGIEAHTDRGPLQNSAWSSNHQLSAAQAMAVFEQLTQRHEFGMQQLFVLGHGPNYPVASNGTPAGQQRNRRVEIVVYPETVDQR